MAVTDPRPYQKSALAQVLDYADEHPQGRALLVLFPRSGKTLIGALAARLMSLEVSLPALWVAGSIEQLEGALEHLDEVGAPSGSVGVIHGTHPAKPDAILQVTTEATISRRTAPPADLVIWDEAHHDAAPRRRRIRKLYPGAFHLGLTGTPERLTGMGLDEDYDVMFVPVQPSELIHDGYISVPTVYAPEDKHLPNMRGVRIRGGDFEISALEKLVGHREAIDKMVEHWAQLSNRLPTLAFAVSVAHSKAIVARFDAAGIKAIHVDADTPATERREIGEKLLDGTYKVGAGCGIFSEGVNMPWVKCCLLGRPTRSRALHIQQSSRCMTPYQDIRPIIIDMVGNHYRFGYPYADRSWSLSRSPRSGGNKEGARLLKRCARCSAIVSLNLTKCPSCGAAFAPEVVALPPPKKLVEVRFTPEEVARKRAQLEAFAAERKFKDGWVDRVIAAMTGDPSVQEVTPENQA